MTKFLCACLFLGISSAVLAAYAWPHLFEIRHYTEDELVGLTCAELGEKHEEVIFAYHDASIAQYNRTGAFEDGLGLPREEVLPFVILMKNVILDNDLRGFDLTKPFFLSASATPPMLHSAYHAEASSVCATNPTMDAVEAMLLSARNLELMHEPVSP